MSFKYGPQIEKKRLLWYAACLKLNYFQGVPKRLLKRRPILFGSSKIENCPLAQKKWVLHIKMCRILMWIHVIANLRSKFNKEPANDQNVQNFKFPAWSCQNFSTETQNPGNWTRHHFGIHLGNPLCILLLIILDYFLTGNTVWYHFLMNYPTVKMNISHFSVGWWVTFKSLGMCIGYSQRYFRVVSKISVQFQSLLWLQYELCL